MQILPTAMTCLPTAAAALFLDETIGNLPAEDKQSLLRALRLFSETAGSLEQSYGKLQSEVSRLRRELENSNGELARSLDENRTMRNYLDRMLEALPCGVLAVRGEQITRQNPEAARLLREYGVLSEIAQLPIEIQQWLKRARRDGNESEAGVLDEKGHVRWLTAKHADVGGSDSVFILRDISERKHLEETRARIERDRALAEMSTLLAHEVRNPLGSMELFAGLLAESSLDGNAQAWVEHIQAGLRTLTATVNNVLHFHSLPKLEFQPIDLGALLEWARAFCSPLAHQAGITLSLQNSVAGVQVAADRHRLEQVMLNLVLNAICATAGGGWIEISGHCASSEGAVSLAVADTGSGIGEGMLSNVFEAGFSSRSGSPGLGLAVCRKIIEQHGGSIRARNRPGAGAVFTIELPWHDSEVQA